MNEIQIVKSILYIGLGFVAYFAFQYYVFDAEINVWWFAFVPIGKEIAVLGYKYYEVWKLRDQKGLITLKETKYKANDFIGITFALLLVAYVRIDVIHYLVPMVLINYYLLYKIKRNQLYYFGNWSIEDMTENKSNIPARNILSIEIETNRIKIDYLANEYADKDDKDNQKALIVHRQDLLTPKSWYEFETIVRRFESNIEDKRKDYQQKTAILDS